MNLFARVINGFEIKDTSSPNKIHRQVKLSKEKNYGKILESLWLIEKNDFAQSRTLLAEAIEESRRGESWEEEYASLSVLMICEAENQRIKEAEQLNQQTEYLDTVMQKKGVNRDNIWIALNKFAQGLILEKKPDIEHSILFYESAVLLFDEVHVDYYQQRLFQKLGEFHEQVGNYNIALSYLHQQIYASLDEIKPNSPIRIYESIANIHIEKGQYDIALYYLQSSINILDNLNQKDDFHVNLRALLQQQVGRIYISIGNLDQAIYYLELSSTVFQDQDDQKQLGWATMQLGLTNHKKGLLEKAMSSYETCVAIFQNLSDQVMVGWSLRAMGDVNKLIGNYNTAIDYYQQNLSLVEGTDNHSAIADCLNRIGKIHHLRQDFHVALDYFQQSFSIFIKIGEKFSSVDTLLNLIKLKLELKSFDQAKFLLGILGEIKEQTQNQHVHLKHKIGTALLLKNNPRIIQKVEAQKIFQEISSAKIVDHQLTVLSMLNLCDLLISELFMYQEKDVLQEILVLLEDLHIIAQDQRSFPLLVEVLLRRSKFAIIEGDAVEANNYIEQAELLVLEKDLKHLIPEIEEQKTSLVNNLSRWEELNRQNATIREKLLLANLDTYMDNLFASE